MRVYILGTILIALLAYSFKPIHREPTLEPYVEEFQSLATCTNKYSLSTEYANLDDGDIGMCSTNDLFKKALIQIDKRNWLTLNEDEKYSLMMHELAHCLLNAEHIPNSLHFMYSGWNPTLSRDITTFQLKRIIKDFCEKRY